MKKMQTKLIEILFLIKATQVNKKIFSQQKKKKSDKKISSYIITVNIIQKVLVSMIFSHSSIIKIK